MYLRFVHAKPEKASRRRFGILRGIRTFPQNEEIDALCRWLNAHLPVPPRRIFSVSRGLSWFKPDAHQPIERVRRLAHLLRERQKCRIWEIYSRDPGLITYEDDLQIVAVPKAQVGSYR